jgi:hypothetical protein
VQKRGSTRAAFLFDLSDFKSNTMNMISQIIGFSQSAASRLSEIKFLTGLFLALVFFAGCSTSRKSNESAPSHGYSEGDIRPFLRVKTLYYFENLQLVDVTQIPFVPLQQGREFGYVIPVKNGAPEWKIKEVLTVSCQEGVTVHPRHQKERVLEWTKPVESLKIQSHNEFDETDCPGTYNFQVYVDGFLIDSFSIFVKSPNET